MRPVVLCILDGWGLSPSREANAVALGRTPNFDRIWESCPHATLAAHGPDVGLPAGQMGNSEVGHTNIGAGRVVWMDLPRIDNALGDGSFAGNPELGRFIALLKASGGIAHVAGLASPGGVHAHQRHIVAAAAVIAGHGVKVAVHAFLDGRDVPPSSAAGQVAELEAALPGGARIATVSGRFYAMDRDRRWERVAQAATAVLRAEGPRAASAEAAIAAAYARGETDEFVTPTVVGDYAGARTATGCSSPTSGRTGRGRSSGALVDPRFDGFAVEGRPRWAAVLGMVQYSDLLDRVMPAVFPSQDIANTLGSWVAGHGLAQFRIAETEKYPHVTFFLNGGVEVPADREARYMAPSPKVRTYDLAPEMSAAEVTEHLVAAIRSGEYALLTVNYANPDMVGHTGILAAAIRAVEAVDEGLGEVLRAVEDDGRGDHRHRRPRQLRGDGRSRDRRAAHRAHAEPGAGGPRRRAGGGAAARRAARGPGADAAGADGAAAAAGDDRPEPDRRGMIRRAALLLGLALAAPAFAGASDPAAAIAAASARVAEAGVGLEAARAAGADRVVALGAAIEEYEAALAALRAGVGAAGGRERVLTLGLATRRQEIARLVAALQAMGRTPPPAAGAASAGAARRGAGGGDDGADRAGAARAGRGAFGGARRRRGGARGAGPRAGGARGRARGARGRAGRARGGDGGGSAGARGGGQPGADDDGARQRDADRARRGAGRGRRSRRRRPAARPRRWPGRSVAQVLRGFDEPDAAGVRRPGVVLRAGPLSLVRAPAAATVRYAGPFLEYGYVVVLEPAPGTMVVLAGLAQLQARAGATVERGEPLGLLGGRPLGVEEYVMLPQSDTGAGGGETLYIEVRQGQGPVDPQPLFADLEQDGLP